MTTISEFVQGVALEETIVSNCPTYREKFQKIIDKAGVGDSDIKDDNALNTIRSTRSWNWAGFVFSSFWAIYRKENVLGWGTLIFSFFLSIVAEIVPAADKISSAFPFVLSIVFGMYGTSFILRNALKTYSSTTSSKDREQRSTVGVLVAISLTIAFVGIWFFLIIEGIVGVE
jgi:hypothetical protein